MKNSEIFFRVYFITIPSETIKILGNHESLGSWNLNKGLKLITNSENYPYWFSEKPIIVPIGIRLEYKCAVFSNDQLVRWESLIGNANRDYRGRSFRVILEFREGDLIYRENVLKKFASSENFLNDLQDYKRMKKSRKIFNPFSNAQEESLSEGSGEDSSKGRSSSDELQDNIFDIQKTEEDEIPSVFRNVLRINSLSQFSKNTKTQSQIAIQNKPVIECRDDILSVLYSELLSKRSARTKTTLIVKTGSQEESQDEDLDDEPGNLTKNDLVLHAVFKLPFEIEYTPNSQSKWKISPQNDTYISTLQSYPKNDLKSLQWIGWPGIYVPPTEREELSAILSREFNCIPIFLDQEKVKKFLDEYCSNYLHELFYNRAGGHLKDSLYHDEYWKLYEEVNEKFAGEILKNTDYNTILIIHDYYLLLTPRFIIDRNPSQLIAYDFESAFPVYETFKMIHECEQILNSMLCSDLICFISSEYVKSFFSVANKILNIDHESQKGGHMYLKYMGRKIFVRVCNPSIQPSHINKILESDNYKLQKNKLNPINNNNNNNDNGEYTNENNDDKKPISMTYFTLYAKNEFLENLLITIKDYFELHRDNLYILTIYEINERYITTTNSMQKAKYKKEIISLVDAINGKLKQNNIQSSIIIDGYNNIHQQSQHRSQHQHDSQYQSQEQFQNLNDNDNDPYSTSNLSLSNDNNSSTKSNAGSDKDAVVLTKERKYHLMENSKIFICFGNHVELYLNILEYIYLTKNSGIILISEFTSTLRNLMTPIKINQFNKKEILKILHKYMNFNAENQEYLLENDRKAIIKYSAWDRFENILIDLKRLKSLKSRVGYFSIKNSTDFRLIAMNQKIRSLPFHQIIEAFKKSKNRIIFLSWEGALIQDYKDKSNYTISSIRDYKLKLTPEEIELFNTLCNKNDLEIHIISNRKFDSFGNTFDNINNIGLLAEYGFIYKLRKQSKLHTLFGCDWWWKTTTQKIMQNYANRTDGVCLDVKDSSICWNYENTGNDLIKIQAKELVNHLNIVLEHSDSVEVLTGYKSIEVKPSGINKGVAIELLLKKIQTHKGVPDFILCIGGTSIDEEMFNKLMNPTFREGLDTSTKIFTVCSSKKPSSAQYYVNNVFDVYKLLSQLSN